ncbi:hypothetical protein SCP_0407490 [Sparassis crispa]|uniref:Enhancer of mRNA-decapping protein n=1 Tax=Sparassis crispa TaxID=139825 RepID=A0A401GJM9_9APHY|nr:hypothetical protein SCP_0407490 [Sparassis crispa]GBE82365.1 hypothetical protein SCP_0407490 [Sparassis crispa]
MDPIAARDNVFSRGPTPPPQPQQHFQVPLPPLNPSPSPSHRETVPSTSTSRLDTLLHGLNAPSVSHVSPQPSSAANIYPGLQEPVQSGPATPASVNAGSVSSSASAPSNPAADRQNALLSLLGAVSPPSSNAQIPPASGPPPPQQIPTPPGSAPRGMPSNESQGKLLLEQLMSGSAPKYNYPETQPSAPSLPAAGPSPPYMRNSPEAPLHHDIPYYGESPYPSHEPPRDSLELQVPPSQQRAPSPARRSMFDFVSPFDALATTSTSAKRKPAPTQPTNLSSGSVEDNAWTPAIMDPKRKSVENLMDQLTRGQAAPVAPPQLYNAPYDPYAPSEDTSPQVEPVQQARMSRPLPPQPPQPSSSPRGSPPKPQNQRQQRRSTESPIGPAPATQGPFAPGAIPRDKEGPSNAAQPYRTTGPESRGRGGPKGKNVSPSSQPQSIVFDVSQPLDEIQAPPDAVKSTAIALVKVDSTFLPGTTIGATHWVAYAMTKGRVRVISRSSGDRTLMQLPQLFPPSTSVTDMSVHGNRLAGVTSDGGFVVWELPEIITDDVPGKVMLCVLPTADGDALHAVKWHPQRPDLVAVASDTDVYLINIADAAHIFGGEPIPQSELHRVGQIFSVPSSIVAIDFDVPRSALATISEDSILTMWNINDKLPFWSHKVRGDDVPSSLTFVEGGVVVGRKNGTVFQLLAVMGRNVLSTVKFINSGQDDPDMFGHASYDSRIQTLWIANNRRDSMIAFKINFDMPTPSPGSEELGRGAYFEQAVEFCGPKPTIHFVILTADADPTGEEAHAACVAAKVPPGDLALVAFSVHSTGVDQVLIRKEWYTSALASASARFPAFASQQPQASEPKPQRQPPPPQVAPGAINQPPPPSITLAVPLPRLKTPPSEEVEGEGSRDEGGRFQENKGRNAKGKNVGWKDNDTTKDKDRDKDGKNRGDAAVINESPLGVALSKEIRKVEESLHTRIGRLIGKELDKQHQRLEDARANEQAADFVRQEKILKLISTELTKNTTRVVEMAVRTEVQNSVLPSLENITKNEVKAALSNQIAKGLSDSMNQSLPSEVERMLLRPEVSSHIARTVSSAVTPIVERHVKDSITKTLIPAYTQQSSTMHQELSREIHTEILNLKKEVITWQSEALRGQESLIRDMEQSVRMLSDQVKFLTINVTSPVGHPMQARSSPGPSANAQYAPQGSLSQLLRHPTLPPAPQHQGGYPPSHGSFQQQQGQPQQQQQQQQVPPMMAGPMPGPWAGASIAAPQASHPTAPPPLPPHAQQIMRSTPPAQSEEWDDTYLAVLGTQDIRQLRELLARSNPDVIMPLNGPSPLSQAVVLTLVHRLSSVIGETSPLDEVFKVSMWWLQRAASVLNTSDPLISPYVARVLPSVQQLLNTTKQRLNILPGGPIEATRAISDIQDILSRKPM